MLESLETLAEAAFEPFGSRKAKQAECRRDRCRCGDA